MYGEAMTDPQPQLKRCPKCNLPDPITGYYMIAAADIAEFFPDGTHYVRCQDADGYGKCNHRVMGRTPAEARERWNIRATPNG
jgi:hypothetical protein